VGRFPGRGAWQAAWPPDCRHAAARHRGRSFGEINQALESVGAQLGFHGGVHTAGFGGKALAEDWTCSSPS